MKRTIINDSSILFDLSKISSLERVIDLPYKFVIPDVIFENEILELEKYKRSELLQVGFVLGRLDSEGVKMAFQLAGKYVRLSKYDAFALAYGKIIECLLLTGDKALRKAAKYETVEVHGMLWLIDEMERHNIVTKERLISVLKIWKNDSSVWLTDDELNMRISRLQQS